MTSPSFVRVAQRTHAAFVPGLWLVASLGYFAIVLTQSSGESWVWKTTAETWGSVLVYCVVPGYLVFCAPYLWNRSRESIVAMRALLPNAVAGERRVLEPSSLLIVASTLAGTLYALSQYRDLGTMIEQSGNLWLDFSMMGANAVVWSTGGWLLGWRLFASSGFCRLGIHVEVDLYNLGTLRPFARVAIADVLVAMGVMALMPLQSLDAEFRWSNYEAGLAVILPAALLFFGLPLWGAHRAITQRKEERVAQLQIEINHCNHSDYGRLEALVAHRDRIRGLNTWPLDVGLLRRVLFYLVIPPLAWIGAALVENGVERFIR